MGIQEVFTAPRSPWQNAYAERFIGSIRRECLDHVIVVNEAGLCSHLDPVRRVLPPSRGRICRWQRTRHTPADRVTTRGPVVAIPQVGGLHHRYDRRAA